MLKDEFLNEILINLGANERKVLDTYAKTVKSAINKFDKEMKKLNIKNNYYPDELIRFEAYKQRHKIENFRHEFTYIEEKQLIKMYFGEGKKAKEISEALNLDIKKIHGKIQTLKNKTKYYHKWSDKDIKDFKVAFVDGKISSEGLFKLFRKYGYDSVKFKMDELGYSRI